MFFQSQPLFCLTDAGKQPCCNILGIEDQWTINGATGYTVLHKITYIKFPEWL